jgi:hypothetical protein
MRAPDSYLHWDASAPSAVEILRRARDLVAFGWCQGVDATDAEHRPAPPWSSRACYWSLLGALAAALDAPQEGNEDSPACIAELRLALVCVSETISAWSLEHWNDEPGRTQAEVVEMLTAAHLRCEARTPDRWP